MNKLIQLTMVWTRAASIAAAAVIVLISGLCVSEATAHPGHSQLAREAARPEPTARASYLPEAPRPCSFAGSGGEMRASVVVRAASNSANADLRTPSGGDCDDCPHPGCGCAGSVGCSTMACGLALGAAGPSVVVDEVAELMAHLPRNQILHSQSGLEPLHPPPIASV